MLQNKPLTFYLELKCRYGEWKIFPCELLRGRDFNTYYGR